MPGPRPLPATVLAITVLAVTVLAASLVVSRPGTGPAAAARPAPGGPPVVIVPGTLAGDPIVEVELRSLADALRAHGYQPFVYYLPGGGLGDMRETAAGLPAFVDGVLDRTGAATVDLIGHSQGGLLGRYYVKNLGGDATVDSFVSLAAPHQGTQLANLGSLFGTWSCLGFGACTQAAVGSAFLADLNSPDDTPGRRVRYTTFTTRFDLIVVPYTNALLTGDGNTNVVVQDQCPLRLVEHVTMPQDGAVHGGVLDALAGRPVTLDCGAL